MKILLVTDDYPPLIGGIASYLHDLYADQERVVARTRWLPHLLATIGAVRRVSPDVLFAGTLFSSGVVTYLAARLFRIPYAVHVYGTDLTTRRRSRLMQRVARAVLSHAARVIVISDFGAVRAEALGVEPARIVKIVPPVDCERFTPAPSKGDSPRVLLTVARLVPRKGHDVVLRALPGVLSRVPGVEYWIAGEGPDRPRLEAMARDLGVERAVRFLGRVEDVVAAYRACSVYVMMSREIGGAGEVEGFGIAFTEAAACAKPVIGGRSGGTAEAIVDGVTGLLVDPEDDRALADAVVALLTDPERATEMGRRGREWVAGELTVAAARARLREIAASISSPPPAILHLAELSFLRAGSQVSTWELLAGRDRGLFRRIVICPPGDEFVEGLRQLGVGVRVAGRHRHNWRFSPGRPWGTLRDLWSAVRATRKAVADGNVKLIHVSSLVAGVVAVLAKRRHPSLRLVMHERGIAYRAHTRLLFRRVSGAMDRIVATTETGRQTMAAWGVAPEKIVVVPNGTDFHRRPLQATREQLRQSLGMQGPARLVGMVANFVRVKRHELFVEVIEALVRGGEDVRGVVVGGVMPILDGARYEAEIRELVRRKGLERHVLFVGQRDDVPEWMSAMDVLLCTSSHESFGRVLIEAMAVGTPVVAMPVGGIVDVVDDGRTGLLAQDAEGLTAAVRRLLHDPALAAALAAAGREEVRMRFDTAAVTRRIEDLYRELLR